MTRLKLAGVAAVVLLAVLAIGYFWGASGRWTLAAELSELRRDDAAAVARQHLLMARVELFTLNFGAAARHLESARGQLERAAGLYDDAGQSDAAGLLRQAAEQASKARELAARLDQSANSVAAEALQVLDRVARPPA